MYYFRHWKCYVCISARPPAGQGDRYCRPPVPGCAPRTRLQHHGQYRHRTGISSENRADRADPRFYGRGSAGQTYHPLLKAGLNISDLGKQDFGFVSRLTYHGGVGLEMKYTPFFSLQPELVYSLQGAAKDINREFRLNYHYLNLPVIARMYVYHDASFHLGLQYGFLLKAVDRDNINNDDITDSVNRHDLAGVIGFGYTLSEKLVFDLRYNIGFTNTAGFDVIFQQRVTNRVMQLSVGYLF
jgi:hypothetical protein